MVCFIFYVLAFSRIIIPHTNYHTCRNIPLPPSRFQRRPTKGRLVADQNCCKYLEKLYSVDQAISKIKLTYFACSSNWHDSSEDIFNSNGSKNCNWLNSMQLTRETSQECRCVVFNLSVLHLGHMQSPSRGR